MMRDNFAWLVMIEAAILIAQIILYFGSEIFQHDPHDVRLPIDDKIPMIPAAAYIYVTWFPLVALYPLGIYYISPESYVQYQAAIIASIILSTAVYLIYPTTFSRRKPPGDFFGRSLSIVYRFDFKGYNCTPSLHCMQCYIVIIETIICPGLGGVHAAGIIALSAAIVVSTMLTKQHVIADAMWAIPAAIVSFAIGHLAAAGIGYEAILGAVGLL